MTRKEMKAMERKIQETYDLWFTLNGIDDCGNDDDHDAALEYTAKTLNMTTMQVLDWLA